MTQKDRTHLIVGGGVIGLCTAYYLSEAGYPVTVLDRDIERQESCSDRNAGMVVPSHFIPLAAPGVVTQGLKWMLNRRSPFYLRPRLDPQLASWCWHFLRHANQSHVDNTKELLRDLSLQSRREFERLADELHFPLQRRGLLMLCRTEAGLEEEREVADHAVALGIEAEVCSPERLRELDPKVQMDVLGGIWFPQDCHLDPRQFLSAMRERIRANGGQILHENVSSFDLADGRVRALQTQEGHEHSADEIILAGGAWTPRLASELSLRLPMQAGKGYSFTLTKPRELPALCSLLKEGRVAVTPMGDELRVAGTMEICGNDLSIDKVRLQGIIQSFCQFFPSFEDADFRDLEPWSGLRPCSPDGLPYIGRAPSLQNVTIATGHAMLGLSLAPITAKLVASSLHGEDLDDRLRPDRF